MTYDDGNTQKTVRTLSAILHPTSARRRVLVVAPAPEGGTPALSSGRCRQIARTSFALPQSGGRVRHAGVIEAGRGMAERRGLVRS